MARVKLAWRGHLDNGRYARGGDEKRLMRLLQELQEPAAVNGASCSTFSSCSPAPRQAGAGGTRIPWGPALDLGDDG
jgi:hypothetical protein